jgi:heme-degrading monooxygenase HmoA
MAKVGATYSSGYWTVKDGKEKAFVAAWLEFVEHAKATHPEFAPVLLKDDEDPKHFVSFGEWPSKDALTAWRSEPEFKSRIGKCIALCDDFKPHDSTLVATPG